MKISAIVITKNEENNIRDCLKSVKWCSELIVVDSDSSDNTLKIAGEFTDRIYSVPKEGVTEKRKLSIARAANQWLMFVDADERVTDELRLEIEKLATDPESETCGYYINRKNYYLGEWITHCGLYPDYHLRLFKKDKAVVTDRIIHEAVEVFGKCGYLKGALVHYSYNSLYQMLQKINFYSTHEAREHFQKNKTISKAGVFTHAIAAFFRIFISRKGYKDRLPGFYVSFTESLTNFLTHLKLLKLQNKI